MDRVLWFVPENNYSPKEKFALEKRLPKCGIKPQSVFYFNLHRKFDEPLIYQRTQTKRSLVEAMKVKAFQELDLIIKNTQPKLIVVNDIAVLWMITDNEEYSLNLTRGGVYYYNNIPCIVLDEFKMLYVFEYANWIQTNDLQKIGRWLNDKQRQEPRFAYEVCHTVQACRDAFAWLSRSIAVSVDIETTGRLISCIGYTGLCDGRLFTYVIPFINPTKAGNNHWDSEEAHIEVWRMVGEFHRGPQIKILQNGGYDNAYFILYRIPLVNYLVDTQHMWHSLYTLLPKRLNFIASILLDAYRYWKDESKGEEDTAGKNAVNNLDRFWRYNALDCYTTFLSAKLLLLLLSQIEWARSNYHTEFTSQIGPALAMSMRGLLLNPERQKLIVEENLQKSNAAMKDLLKMVGGDWPDFNPGSTQDVAVLLYDIMKLTPIKMRGKAKKGERSTDEKILLNLKRQHPLAAKIIEQIWAVKKPLNQNSNYGGQIGLNGRFHYSLSAGGTDTGRYSSKGHQFWIGRNSQNIPANLRIIFCADKGGFFFEADYSQSDAKFVAYECEDPRYIAVFESGKDTHSYHAAHLYKMDYEKIVLGAKNEEDWCVNPITGVRQNTKRAVHGTNFQMAAFTLYIVMGYEAVIASAKAMGFSDAHKWDDNRLVKYVQKYLMDEYHHLYPLLQPWFGKTTKEAVKNGNKVTCAFGKTLLFFGDIESNQKTQREISAFYGQGGTAGNINRCLNHIYWNTTWEKEGLLLLNQVHDSILGWIPWGKEYLLENILTLMEEKFKIKGRELYIPADLKVGLSWGKGGMMGLKRGAKVDREALLRLEEKLTNACLARKQKLAELYQQQEALDASWQLQLSELTQPLSTQPLLEQRERSQP